MSLRISSVVLGLQTETEWESDRQALIADKEEAVNQLVEEATAREDELQSLVEDLQEKLEDIADFKKRKEDVEAELVRPPSLHLELPRACAAPFCLPS